MITKGLSRGEILIGMEQGWFKSGDKFKNENAEFIIEGGRLKYADTKNTVECDVMLSRYDLIEEPLFKVGDWVVYENTSKIIGKIVCIDNVNFIALDSSIYMLDPRYVRKATNEEVVLEGKHRWWASIGRKVDEYKIGDIVTGSANDLMEIVEVHGELLKCSQFHPYDQHFMYFNVSKEQVQLIAPVEQRLDLI